jgi:hypothetical protein
MDTKALRIAMNNVVDASTSVGNTLLSVASTSVLKTAVGVVHTTNKVNEVSTRVHDYAIKAGLSASAWLETQAR